MPETNVEYTEPTEDVLELQRKIELLEQARINLRVSPNVFDRLLKQAEFYGVEIEEHCVNILEESLKALIGKPHINAPSQVGGASEFVAKKITAPTYSVNRG